MPSFADEIGTGLATRPTMVSKIVHEVLDDITEELPATNGERHLIKALVRRSDSTLKKAALRSRVNKDVKAYHALQYVYPTRSLVLVIAD